MTSTIGSNIISSLGTGSGIDTGALVTSLVAAVRDPKEQVLTGRQTLNSARISGIASAASSLATFSTALTDLLKDTSYSGQPASSNSMIASVTALNGGTPTGLPAQIEVTQLAKAQVTQSATLADATAQVGLGTLTLTTARGTSKIAVTSGNNSLNGLARAINDSNAGVTATVMTDAGGSRLVLKGANGEANEFSLTMEPGDTADASLQAFTFGSTATSIDTSAASTMTRSQTAQNAKIMLDGVAMEYADNVVTDAIPFLRIDLNSAAPGTTVMLATDKPTASITDLVAEFVDVFNSLRKSLNDVTAAGTDSTDAGALANDGAIREMKSRLARITTTALSDTGEYRTLSSIGISTNADGTLKLDKDKLAAAYEKDPGAIQRMIDPETSTAGNPGLARVVADVQDALSGEHGALTLATSRYETLAKSFAAQMEKLDKQMVDYEARLNVVYTNMETRLTALKATQSYLKQQIDAWNSTDD
ncbi:MAG: flagellar hook protein [Sphingobium sp. 32-64-5]|nr:MAG: flagellar hook protein [Sphingobium sp. 32-64-5]